MCSTEMHVWSSGTGEPEEHNRVGVGGRDQLTNLSDPVVMGYIAT